MTNIKSLETKYKDIIYRSQLEARWAMFFDCIANKKIYYEEKLFNLGDNIWYLPDFHFVCDENLWDSADFFIEIKPIGGATKLAIKKCKRLASFSKTLVMLIQGFPNEHKVTFFEYNEEKVVKKKCR